MAHYQDDDFYEEAQKEARDLHDIIGDRKVGPLIYTCHGNEPAGIYYIPGCGIWELFKDENPDAPDYCVEYRKDKPTRQRQRNLRGFGMVRQLYSPNDPDRP
jgi:hypothetical protein